MSVSIPQAVIDDEIGGPRPVRVNIIGKSNGVGLARDLELLREALRRPGLDVQVRKIDGNQAKRRRSVWTQSRARLSLLWRNAHAAPSADINIMLEHVWLQYLTRARVNVVVPNPEWFDGNDRRFLRHVDRVWSKTHYTDELFQSLGCQTTYIGFDSYDRLDRTIRKQRTYFHLAGKSSMKGTERLVQVWSKHPEWPSLIVIQHRSSGEASLPANIERRVGYLSDEDLRMLQNESVFHICLSQTEGWGHYIVEALSTRAVTITVDAAPMNELVTSERGVLVSCRAAGTQRLATTYEFDEAGLERAIGRTLTMSDEECSRVGDAARHWFAANKQTFSRRIQDALSALQSVRHETGPVHAANRR